MCSRVPQNFKGIGKLKDYHRSKTNCYTSTFNTIPTSWSSIKSYTRHDQPRYYIGKHQIIQATPCVSNIVITPKEDGSLRMSLDARNANKVIIPRYEDMKSKLAGCSLFSKIDFKANFWQIELEDSSRYLSVFNANEKLYKYKRLIMSIKPAQGEPNVALKPIFMHIDNTHLIHDD